jgi:hypothetical protein
MWYDERMVKDKFYYIVGVSLLVLLVLVVYVGSRAQNLELGLVNVDARLSVIESQLNIVNSAAYYGEEGDMYNASVYDAFDGSYYDDGSEYVPYDYVVE